MSFSFEDERLCEYVSYQFQGGPTFSTREARQFNGYVNRAAVRVRPLYRFRAPYDSIEPANRQSLVNAYVACLGPVVAFRFKDWADYQLTDEVIGTAVGGTDETMQIIKSYTFGTRTITRTITKPVDSTKYNQANGYVADAVALSVTEDTGGGPVSLAHTVDYDTGILTFTSTAGAIIRVTGEFDVPVRFKEDEQMFDYVNWEAHSTEILLEEDFAA